MPLTRPVLLTGAILVTINVWGDYLWPTIVIQDPHRTTISAGVQQFVGSFGLNLSQRRRRVRRIRHRHRADVRPRRLHHALFRLRTHRRSHQSCDHALPADARRAALRAPGQPARRRPRPGAAQLAAGGHGTGRAQSVLYQVFLERGGALPAATLVWDSGRVDVRPRRRTSRTTGRRWPGAPGTPGGSGSGTTPARRRRWSDPARFEVELDPADGWHGSWIGLGRVGRASTPPDRARPGRPGERGR